MNDAMTEIYPKELVLLPDDNNGRTAPFLDLQLLITEGINVMLLIFLLLTCQAISQIKVLMELVRYARGCTFLSDFASGTLLLVKKLKNQGFTTKRLQQTYRKHRHIHRHTETDITCLVLYRLQLCVCNIGHFFWCWGFVNAISAISFWCWGLLATTATCRSWSMHIIFSHIIYTIDHFASHV